MTGDDTDDIYRALKLVPAGEKDVLMLLVSYNGQTQPAYQIGSGMKVALGQSRFRR